MAKARIRMMVVDMGRENPFLRLLLKLEGCNMGLCLLGAKNMTDNSNIVLC